MTTARFSLQFLLCLLILAGCEQPLATQSMTKEEALSFAKMLEERIGSGKLSGTQSIIDDEIFAREVALAANKKNNSEYIRGIQKALKEKKLEKELVKQVTTGTHYKFVRYYEKEKRHHVLFRLYGNDGLNYHDFELVKRDGKVRVADAFIFIAGEKLSQSLAVIMNSLMDEKASDAELEMYAKNLSRIKSMMAQEKFTAAKELLSTMPQTIRGKKIFQIMNLQISSHLENDSYMEAIREFESLYAGDPAAQLVMFDGYVLKGDFGQALQVLNSVDSTIHDPFLHYYRGLVFRQLGEQENATMAFEKLTRELPDFDDGFIELMATYLETDQQQKAKKLLAAYKTTATFSQEKLQNISLLYPEFATEISQ
jgi:thioredoxin-like negative regulator of GroEL